MRLASLLLLPCLALSSCGGHAAKPATSTQQLLASTLSESTSILREGSEALEEFRPLVESGFEGGECVAVRTEPAPDVRTLVVHFPDKQAPRTALAVTLDADAKVIRYIENHGVPRPSRDPTTIQDAIRMTPQTIITLDFVTGQAVAYNRNGDAPRTGVRGGVSDFERAGLVHEVRRRVEEAKALCASREG